MNRRDFLKCTLAAAFAGGLSQRTWASQSRLRIGVTDWDLFGVHFLKHDTPRPEAVARAKGLGFEGLEINLGRRPDAIPLADPALQEAFLEEVERHEIAIRSTCLDILHQNPLKSDPLGKQWLAEAIPITERLGARVILLPFFGDGALETDEEIVEVAKLLKAAAPKAEEAGVVLGVEDTLSARDNARLLDRVGSDVVRVYYDVGNSQNRGYDVVEEIGWLGAERICQFHLKDNPHYLGEGEIDFEAVLRTIRAIDFEGWGVFETSSPSGNVEADLRQNLEHIRAIQKRL